MLVDILLYIVHWLLAFLLSLLPTMTTPPDWLVSVAQPIAYGWHILDGIFNASVVVSFIAAIIPIVVIYEIFHFTHQTTLALRGTAVDKSHL